jgi:hypothetical protein
MGKPMKQFLICLLLASLCFPLAAQTAQTVSVYMPIFTGTGIDEQDSAFYFMYIYREIEARDNITIGRASFSTDYTILGAISPMVGADGTFYFELSVYDNITGNRISDQRYRYSSLSNAEVALKTMLDNIFTLILPVQPVEPPPQTAQQPVLPSQIPARPVTPPAQQQPAQPQDDPAQPSVLPDQIPVQPPDGAAQPPVKPNPNEDWRDRRLFLGISVAWAPRIYDDGERQASNMRNFGLGFYPELQLMDSVALGMGMGLSPEWIAVGENEGENFRDMILAVPLLLKIVLKLGDSLMLEPYSGISFNFPFFGVTKPPALSWVVGYQHNVKTGPGAFFFDFRFFMDIGKSTLEDRPPIPKQEYQRYGMEISAGYKLGLVQK